ncbi:MAG: transposase [Verrucomicrobia bacterium]|nr:transposase [Verrucomicrobiota bacterium]
MRLSPKYSSHRTPARRNFAHLEVRRREGMRLLTQGVSQSDVARRLKVSEVSVSRWKQALVCRGGDAWRRGRLGKPPKLVSHHLEVIRLLLNSGARMYGFTEDRWTYKRLATALKTLTGLDVHPDHLCRVVHRHGLSSRSAEVAQSPCSREGSRPAMTPSRAVRPAGSAVA